MHDTTANLGAALRHAHRPETIAPRARYQMNIVQGFSGNRVRLRLRCGASLEHSYIGLHRLVMMSPKLPNRLLLRPARNAVRGCFSNTAVQACPEPGQSQSALSVSALLVQGTQALAIV